MKLIFTLFLMLNVVNAHAKQEQFTTIQLKYITTEDAISVLRPLTDKKLSADQKNNILIIKESANKSKNIINLLKNIDTPAIPLTLEFIATNEKINFKNTKYTYNLNRAENSSSQTLAITERQWVNLNTGVSIPIAERTRSSDGSVSETIRYKDVKERYLFKVHEFNGKSIVQIKLDASSLNNSIAGAIDNTKLDTTITGNTGEWLEVATSKSIIDNATDNVFSTKRRNKKRVYLYIKIKK